MRILFL